MIQVIEYFLEKQRSCKNKRVYVSVAKLSSYDTYDMEIIVRRANYSCYCIMLKLFGSGTSS